MARYSAAWRSAGAGSTTLPIAGLMAQANTPLWVVEVWATNTTTGAISCALRKIITSAGTPGASMQVFPEENDTVTVKGDPRDTWTVAPTFATGTAQGVRNAAIGASVGSGDVFTFGGRGLYVPPGTTNGVALIPLVGAGAILDVSWSWDA
jgi:hypothetical protein